MESHGNRHRHIDAYHAGLNPVREVPRIVTVSGENGGTVAIFMAINNGQGAFIVRRAHDTQYRAENLLAIDHHIGGDMIKQGAAYVKSVLVPRYLDRPAIDYKRRAFPFPAINIIQHFAPVGR